LFGGLVVTEFNPDHADEEGEVAAALAAGLASPRGARRLLTTEVSGWRSKKWLACATHTRADLDGRCAVPYAPECVEGAFAKG
jgi:hypothetical protein